MPTRSEVHRRRDYFLCQLGTLCKVRNGGDLKKTEDLVEDELAPRLPAIECFGTVHPRRATIAACYQANRDWDRYIGRGPTPFRAVGAMPGSGNLNLDPFGK